jgi:hypothetical protein
MNRNITFKRKGVTFRVEEFFEDTTPNNNVWVLNKEGNHWDWKMLTTWDYEKVVRSLKRKGMDYFKED